MKRVLALVLALSLICSLAGCGLTDPEKKDVTSHLTSQEWAVSYSQASSYVYSFSEDGKCTETTRMTIMTGSQEFVVQCTYEIDTEEDTVTVFAAGGSVAKMIFRYELSDSGLTLSPAFDLLLTQE